MPNPFKVDISITQNNAILYGTIAGGGAMKRILTFLVAIAVSSMPAFASQPQAPVEVSIGNTATVTGLPRGTVTLAVTLTALHAADIRLRVFVEPSVGAPVDERLAFDEVINVGTTQVVSVAIPVKAAGDFRVGVIAEEAGGSVSDGTSVYVRLTDKGEARLMPPAEYNSLHVQKRRGQPSIILGSGKVTSRLLPAPPVKANAPDVDNPLRLTGNISTTLNQVVVPMATVHLQVWDEDTLSPDDLLGETDINPDGSYFITIDNDDGLFGGGVDVYLLITSSVPAVQMFQVLADLENRLLTFNYVWRSPTTDDIHGVIGIQQMDFSIGDHRAEAAAWMGVSRAAALVRAATGRTLRSVEVRNPGLQSGTFFNQNANFINVDSSAGNAPEVLGHEYAHAVMFQAYGSNLEGGLHEFCPPQPISAGLAWSEGFATALGLRVGNGNGTMHWSVGDTGLSIENWSCSLRDISTDEGRIAAVLWDLLDSANDDNGGLANRGVSNFSDTNQGPQLVSLADFLNPLWLSVQHNVTEYWGVLKPRLNATTQLAPSVNIMNYNYYQSP